MVWPDATEYDHYVSQSEVLEAIPGLKGGKPRPGVGGIHLEAITGGYCVVYPIEVGDQTFALRCWYKEIGEAKERYQKIADYLKARSLSYFVDFKYLEEGIPVGGKKYPIIRMEWFEDGMQLNEFLDKYVNDTKLVSELAEKFKEMVKSLHKHEIAHGDLQDGNILVRLKEELVELKLVDYDSLVVPELNCSIVEIYGLPAYQHPNRKYFKKINQEIDYFSELVIYLSLCAYAEKPDLWTNDQEQKLLFDEEDFKNPFNSERFKELKGMSPNIQLLAEKLVEFCKTDHIDRLLPLEEVLDSIGEPTLTPSRLPPSPPSPHPTEPFDVEKFVPDFSELKAIEGPQPGKRPEPSFWIMVAVLVLGLIELVTIAAWFLIDPATKPFISVTQSPTATEAIATSVTQSPTNEPECRPRMVLISNSNVCLDVYEVTNKAYQECVAASICSEPDDKRSKARLEDPGGYYGNPAYDNYPVIRVNWEQAKMFCEFDKKRLPKAAEWKEAANYNWPSEAEIKKEDTEAVGSTGDISPQKIHNLADNVREWVDDADEKKPSEKVVKGFSFNSPTGDFDSLPPSTTDWGLGFRCAVSQ